ncbi:uncharacterized protein [Primulina huaijiensis]|uniref:uncharacterized protein n=1 Tax=Primulina huaijiensis TaxID=1492673 RepID=UPI003CC74E0E
MEELRVSDLMRSNPQQWDIGLLNELFNDRDVKAILQILLQETNCPDSWVWHYSKTGNYIVKSGYWVGLETSSLSEENGVAGEWGKIWNLQVPPKVKHFLWRATRNCLPVRASLQRKGIQVPLTCAQCGVILRIPSIYFLPFHLPKAVGVKPNLCQVVHFALQNLYDWLQAKEKKKVLHPNSNSVDTSCKRWHKPPAFLKCNTDAALFTSSNTFGLSGVLRDENGEFIACRMQHNAGNPAVKVLN